MTETHAQPDADGTELAFAIALFEAQPFSRLIGAELVSLDKDGVELGLTLRDDLTQQHGYAHGGVLSYLADNAISFAGGIGLRSDVLTSEFKINYLRPAKGPRLIARASARGVSRRQAVCVCEIRSVGEGEDKLCAIAQGTVVKLVKG